MSITSTICKHIYQADGQTRDFEIDFPILSAQDIEVYVTSAEGTETKITQNYTVNTVQGTVTYPTVASGLDPVETSCKVTLVRTTPLTQEITLTQQGVLDAKSLEGGYDKIVLQLQEIAEQVKRCIKYAVSSGKTEADADAFLAQLQAAQTAALTSALASVEEIKTSLLQSMSEEATYRAQGDLTLQQNVQTLAGTINAKDSAQTAALTAESTMRQTADSDLQTAISAEAQARLTADNTLNAQIATLPATYVPLTQKAVPNGIATLDASGAIPNLQIPQLPAIAPYIQKYEVGNFNTQTVVNANDLLTATGNLHALDLTLSANTKLQKLTASGTNNTKANLRGVLVSPQAPFDSTTNPQLDVSYTELNRSALVNLFNSMPYNVGYTVTGSPTITNDVASAFSSSDYLSISTSFDPGIADFNIGTGVVTGNVNSNQRIISDGASSDTSTGLTFSSTNKNFRFRIYDNVASQGYVVDSSVTVAENSSYAIKAYRQGTTLGISVSTDGENWTTDTITLPQTLSVKPTTLLIGQARSFVFNGSINLNQTYINVNGIAWFRGTATMTKTCCVVGCTGTADLTQEDKDIVLNKGWELTVA